MAGGRDSKPFIACSEQYQKPLAIQALAFTHLRFYMAPLKKTLTALCSISGLLILGACGGGDSSGPEPSVATTITANSSTNLTAVVGAAVSEAPSVLVRDQRGAPMSGVPVGFTVTGGGGSVAQGSATTNSSGVATVGNWTLGATVGTNTLVASTGSLTAVTFTANATAGAPAAITKTSGDAQTATAGTSVAIPPSVTVKDANGNPVSGVSVVFAPAAGGGSVTGGVLTTNSAGIATVGSWTLGTIAGLNTLSVSAGTATPAVFSATAVAGSAATLTKNGGDNQTASAGSPVQTSPSVVVRDAYGNPVSGVTVIFSVGAGGGTVAGGTQTSNAIGAATVGSWTLGPTSGSNTLIASVTGLTPVTFTATATASAACTTATTYVIGNIANGTLSTSDCVLSDGSYIDFFATSNPTPNAFLFTESAGFDALLVLYAASGAPIGVNDDFGVSTNSTIKALLPAGNYVLGATSFDPGVTGAYSLSSSATSSSINNCEDVFIVRGLSTAQTLQASDCVIGSFYSDDVFIFLTAGQTITVSMNSTEFDTYLEIYGPTGAFAADNDDRDAATTDAQIVYTAPTDGFYLIAPTSANTSTTGAYTLIIQ